MTKHRELSGLAVRQVSRVAFASVGTVQVPQAVVHTLPFSAIAYCRVRLTVWNSVFESGIATVATEGDVCIR